MNTLQKHLRLESLETRHLLTSVTFVERDLLQLPDLYDMSTEPLPVTLAATDIDGDNDVDLTIAYNVDRDLVSLVSYQNTNGEFLTSNPIDSVAYRAAWNLLTFDIDGDSDIDILLEGGVAFGVSEVRLYEHQETPNGFVSLGTIEGSGLGTPYEFADIDADGDFDLYSEGSFGLFRAFVIYWNDGIDNLQQATLDLGFRGGRAAHAADFDSDSDLDLIVRVIDVTKDPATYRNVFFENSDGIFTARQTLSENENSTDIADLTSGDMDGDGDLDIIAFLDDGTEQRVFWHENTDGSGTFGEPNIVVSRNSEVIFPSISVADLDGDGDADILETRPRSMIWHENVGGGGFLHRDIGPSGIDERQEFLIADIDGDSYLDVIAAGQETGKVVVLENRIIGDSNHDRVFDSSDLVAVFKAGKYEDDSNGNATFNEGDWNHDGNFDSGDLVLAFQAGTFVAAYSPESDLLSAVDWIFADIKDERLNI